MSTNKVKNAKGKRTVFIFEQKSTAMNPSRAVMALKIWPLAVYLVPVGNCSQPTGTCSSSANWVWFISPSCCFSLECPLLCSTATAALAGLGSCCATPTFPAIPTHGLLFPWQECASPVGPILLTASPAPPGLAPCLRWRISHWVPIQWLNILPCVSSLQPGFHESMC